jgi:hypothetical protein
MTLKATGRNGRSKSMLRTRQVDERSMDGDQPSTDNLCGKLRATKSRSVYPQGIRHQAVVDGPFRRLYAT